MTQSSQDANEVLIEINENTFGELKLLTDIAQPLNLSTSTKYIPDNGKYDVGMSEIINWYEGSQQSWKYPVIGGNVGVTVGVVVGVWLGIGQELSTQGNPIEYVTGPITTGSLPQTYTVVLAYILYV